MNNMNGSGDRRTDAEQSRPATLRREDCLALLHEYGTPEHVIRHCIAVADAAVRLAEALRAVAATELRRAPDIELTERAALLHDIARIEENHAKAGANIVAAYDTAAAEIIAGHMTHDFPDSVRDICEADIVSLADRSVFEYRYIGYEARMNKVMARFADNETAIAVMKGKIQQTETFIAEIERITGRGIDEIIRPGIVSALPLLKYAERPGRYIGGEIHSARKDTGAVQTRFCFAFPDLYEIGMSYTGLQIIYSLLNAMNEVYCERAFAPALDMEALMRAKGIPLFTLETHTDLKYMDIIGFTVQYEQCYTNVIRMLELAGIPPLAKDRADHFPLIIAGGPCVYNPEPLAEVFDAIAIGDGEELLPELCRAYNRAKMEYAQGEGSEMAVPESRYAESRAQRGESEMAVSELPHTEGRAQSDESNRSVSESRYAEGRVQCANGNRSVPELRYTVGGARSDGSKAVLLKALAAIEGVYIPSFYTPVYRDANGDLTNDRGVFSHFEKQFDWLPDTIAKRVVRDLNGAPFPVDPIVPFIETVHDRAVAEIFRGCGRGCRFCQAGFVYRPVRRRSREKIVEIINGQLSQTGYDEVSLLSLSTGDYPGIGELTAELMADLKERDVSLSLPSLRLDSISEETLRRIGSGRKSGLTFAPEAGTQRLRDVIHKNITEEHIMSGVEKAITIGWTHVKFYFMVGLPTETYEDLDGIVELAAAVMRRARSLQEKGNRNFNLTVSVSNFVPKPHTPFQWAEGDSEETLRKKNFYLKDRIKRLKGVHFQFHDTRASHVEMLLAKGDRRMIHAVLAAVRLGCAFDSWREHFNYELWMKAFETAGLPVSADAYTEPGLPLPWEIIDTGTPQAFLMREYEMSVGGGDTAPAESKEEQS
jgi:radical SAM family uncharacterized protein